MARICSIAIITLLVGCAKPPPKLLALPPNPLPAGWSRFESGRVSIGLPPKWKALDIKAKGVDAFAAIVDKSDPGLAAKIGKDLRESIQNSTISVFALDEGAKPGKGDQLNISGGPDAPLGMRAASDIVIGSLRQSLEGSRTELRHTIRLPIGDAVEYIVSGRARGPDGKLAPLTVQGYVMLNETEGIMVSLQTSEPSAARRKLFLEIAQSLRISP